MTAPNRTYQPSNFGPGILEFRRMAPRTFGIRVKEHLVAKLKKVPGLTRANPKSNLFLLEVDDSSSDVDGALLRFKKIVSQADLGRHFGLAPWQEEKKKKLEEPCLA